MAPLVTSQALHLTLISPFTEIFPPLYSSHVFFWMPFSLSRSIHTLFILLLWHVTLSLSGEAYPCKPSFCIPAGQKLSANRTPLRFLLPVSLLPYSSPKLPSSYVFSLLFFCQFKIFGSLICGADTFPSPAPRMEKNDLSLFPSPIHVPYPSKTMNPPIEVNRVPFQTYPDPQTSEFSLPGGSFFFICPDSTEEWIFGWHLNPL